MSYSGTNGQYHQWEKIEDIQTVFWVVRKNGTDSNRFLLGDWTGSGESGDYNFHSSGNNYLHSGHASTAYAGTLRENGSLITDPQSTPLPQNISVISLTSDSDLNASNFSNDRNINGRTWKGDLAELLIYNQPLENEKIEEVEGYLAHKWGLVESLDSSHRYKNQVPQFGLGDVFTYADHKQIEPFSFSFHDALPSYLEESLISRWSFNESFIDEFGVHRVKDLSRGRNDGFMMGNALLSKGKFGNALTLDGSGDYLEIPNFRGGYKSKNLTFSAWINLAQTGSNDDADDCSIFSTAGTSLTHSRLWYDINADSTGNRTFSLTLGSTAARFNRTSGTDSLGISDKWQLLVAVMNQEQRTLYVDGVLIAETTSPTSSITPKVPMHELGHGMQTPNQTFMA